MNDLKSLLCELRDRIDEDYGERIDNAVSMKSVDRYHERAIRMTETIDLVIVWASAYSMHEVTVKADLPNLPDAA